MRTHPKIDETPNTPQAFAQWALKYLDLRTTAFGWPDGPRALPKLLEAQLQNDTPVHLTGAQIAKRRVIPRDVQLLLLKGAPFSYGEAVFEPAHSIFAAVPALEALRPADRRGPETVATVRRSSLQLWGNEPASPLLVQVVLKGGVYFRRPADLGQDLEAWRREVVEAHLPGNLYATHLMRAYKPAPPTGHSKPTKKVVPRVRPKARGIQGGNLPEAPEGPVPVLTDSGTLLRTPQARTLDPGTLHLLDTQAAAIALPTGTAFRADVVFRDEMLEVATLDKALQARYELPPAEDWASVTPPPKVALLGTQHNTMAEEDTLTQYVTPFNVYYICPRHLEGVVELWQRWVQDAHERPMPVHSGPKDPLVEPKAIIKHGKVAYIARPLYDTTEPAELDRAAMARTLITRAASRGVAIPTGEDS